MNSSIDYAIRNICDVCAGRDCLDGCIRRLRAVDRSCACAERSTRAPSVRISVLSVALAVVALFFGLVALGDVTCTFDPVDNTYNCSGSGDSVIVGPGPNEMPIVITNSYGCCTNCTAIDPLTLSNLFLRIRSESAFIEYKSGIVNEDVDSGMRSLESLSLEIPNYYKTSAPAGLRVSDSVINPYYTNLVSYLESNDNDQTRVVKSMPSYSSSLKNSDKLRVIGANDAIYDYANQYVLPTVDESYVSLANTKENIWIISNCAARVTSAVDGVLPLLAAAPDCTSSSNGCSSVTGRWCTEEQGEAIIILLREQSSYLDSITNTLSSITRYLSSIRSAYYSLRGGIPSEANLDNTWQDIYLHNSTASFDYRYTNVLERIELLLYGISGVGTNDTSFTDLQSQLEEGGELSPSSFADVVSNKFEEVEDSFSNVSVQSSTIFSALERLFSSFSRFSSSDLQNDQQIIGSFSIDWEDDHIDVPSLSIHDPTPLNEITSFCHSLMTVVWWTIAGFVGVRFYIFFYGYVFRFCKWAWEILDSLFKG